MNFSDRTETVKLLSELLMTGVLKINPDLKNRLSDHLELLRGNLNYHPITSLHSNDLLSRGFIVGSNPDQENLSVIADRVGEAYVENGYWEAIDIFSEEFGYEHIDFYLQSLSAVAGSVLEETIDGDERALLNHFVDTFLEEDTSLVDWNCVEVDEAIKALENIKRTIDQYQDQETKLEKEEHRRIALEFFNQVAIYK